MSSRKRRRSPRKMSLRAKLVVYACLLLGPVLFGGACGAIQYLLPARRSFGQSQQTDESSNAGTAAVVQRCLTGAATGGILGIGACVVFTWASRPKKKKW